MTVGYEVRDEIAYISFNRPEKHCALRAEGLSVFVSALRVFDANDRSQVAILVG
jgi:enoyl-CoA hydratase/carnithine racemase